MKPMLTSSDPQYFAGQFLVAMPTMGDPRFEKTVIYMCSHTPESALGLVVNKPLTDLRFKDVLQQLGILPSPTCADIPIHRGGPVETALGFVLHTADYRR